jgi:hypothetical protein
MHPLLLGILQKAPEIIVIAKKLADGVKAGKKTAEVAERLAALEKNEAQQAELVKEMAKQLSDMSALIKVLSRRLVVCLGCTLVALALAAAALFHSSAR